MKVATFGEIMLRLAPKGYLRFMQEKEFTASFGGGEANVAVSLANYGIESKFVSKLPQNDIGEACIKELVGYGVDTTCIARGGRRIGIYYLEKGASVRPSKVIYDREGTAISEACSKDFDWNNILSDVDWFHFSGITPALSQQMSDITIEALQVCRKKGIKVSCDLNYRKNLWTKERAKIVMTNLMQYIDVLIGNEEDAEDVFGIKPNNNNIIGGKLNKEGYVQVGRQITEMFGTDMVAITLRESLSANDNNWGAMLYSKSEVEFSKMYNLHIVDRVGGGDSFSAGLIYSILNNYNAKEAVNFAVASSALKHTIEGDFNRVSVEEVKRLMSGDASGRVQR